MKATCAHCSAEVKFTDEIPPEHLVCPECKHPIPQKSLKISTVHINLKADMPQEIAEYQILDLVARGAYGTVYRAVAPDGRIVALKVLTEQDMSNDNETVRRFQREAEAAMALNHPNIVRVYDAGLAGGKRHFLAMEYVEGKSLRSKFDRQEYKIREVVKIVRDLASGLHHAHEKGIIHRDLKPENVLITSDGTPKLSDFGIARMPKSKHARLTATGIALGTPEYMSPEQAAGHSHDATHRSDIYSLGVILYEGTTLKLPFEGRTIIDTLRKIESVEPEAPSQVSKGVDSRLEAVILKSMSKKPDLRYGTAGEFGVELERWLAGKSVTATASRGSGVSRFFGKLLGKKKS